MGPPALLAEANVTVDASLRTVRAVACFSTCLCRSPERSVSSVGSDDHAKTYLGLYGSLSFHIRKTIAAIVRARETLARFGLMPDSVIRS